jgi:hypothetical protein
MSEEIHPGKPDKSTRQAEDYLAARKIERLDRQLSSAAAENVDAQAEKIGSAVERCVAECDASNTPFVCVKSWITRLLLDPEWSERDVIEFQTQVIRILMERARGREIGPS